VPFAVFVVQACRPPGTAWGARTFPEPQPAAAGAALPLLLSRTLQLNGSPVSPHEVAVSRLQNLLAFAQLKRPGPGQCRALRTVEGREGASLDGGLGNSMRLHLRLEEHEDRQQRQALLHELGHLNAHGFNPWSAIRRGFDIRLPSTPRLTGVSLFLYP
jgi:hypothetical protein